MSGFGVIHDVSLELRRQVFTALSATPGTDFFLDDEGTNITFSAPGDDLPEGTMASLYLYHLDVDKHLRNQRPLPDRTRYHRVAPAVEPAYVFRASDPHVRDRPSLDQNGSSGILGLEIKSRRRRQRHVSRRAIHLDFDLPWVLVRIFPTLMARAAADP